MSLLIPELDEYGSSIDTPIKLYQFSINHPDLFWGKIAKARLQWFKEFDEVCNTNSLKSFADENFRIKWFSGGKLNATSC
jgi:acetyl-CoA synthetase